MNNIYKFPGGKAPSLTNGLTKVKTVMPFASIAKGLLAVLWTVVRTLLFFVMYWLRFPVMFVCNLVFIPMLLAFLFVWYAFPDKANMVWGFGTVSFLAFIVKWSYDFFLIAISPENVVRSL